MLKQFIITIIIHLNLIVKNHLLIIIIIAIKYLLLVQVISKKKTYYLSQLSKGLEKIDFN